ncbi:MAG: hypothetical protein HQL84_08580 [Magnetococcales bacterium]|nr:hypothetical protein [Magnetococcales bacterium]MBF0150085.1 hypothetical protein [Magnetococcales bacterium]
MIAGSLGTVLSLVLFEILLQAQYMADSMIMQSTLNSQAREVFDLLMDGGVKAGGSSTVGTDRVPGVHGRNLIDDSVLSRVSGITTTFRIRLGPESDPTIPKIMTSEILPTFTVSCSAPGTPIKTCGTDWTGKTYTVDGFVDYFKFENFASGGLVKTYNVSLTLIDSYRVPRSTNSQRFSQMEYSTSFWTALTLILD